MGVDWQNDQVFAVETTKTVQYPTHKKGIEKQSKYKIVTYEFSATKHPTDKATYPFANIFELAETSSAPIDIDDISPPHVNGVIGHFVEHFSKEMYDFAAPLADIDPQDEDSVLDYDSIDPGVLLEICELVCGDLEMDIRETSTTGYRVFEFGNRLEHYIKHTYEVGSTSYEILTVDSGGNGNYTVAHSEDNDGHPEEVYFVEDAETIPKPDCEIMADDVGQRIIDEDEFFAVIEESFGYEDHLAISYVEHAERMFRIIKAARGRTY